MRGTWYELPGPTAHYWTEQVQDAPPHVWRWRQEHPAHIPDHVFRYAIVRKADAGPRGGRTVLTSILHPVSEPVGSHRIAGPETRPTRRWSMTRRSPTRRNPDGGGLGLILGATAFVLSIYTLYRLRYALVPTVFPVPTGVTLQPVRVAPGWLGGGVGGIRRAHELNTP